MGQTEPRQDRVGRGRGHCGLAGGGELNAAGGGRAAPAEAARARHVPVGGQYVPG